MNWKRSAFQGHHNVSYVFLGSKQSLMESIFADSNSPFYEFGIKLSIKEISNDDWRVFIRDKFKKTGLEITDDTISSILEKTNGHPHFTQYFSSVVWELLREDFDQTNEGFTAQWMGRIIKGQSIIFQNILDQLNKNQRKVLLTIASLKPNEQLFSENIRKRYCLPASSTLSVTVDALLKKDLINKDINNYTIQNPVLKEWLLLL